jgi:peptide/nickel transport system ATP-binding protein
MRATPRPGARLRDLLPEEDAAVAPPVQLAGARDATPLLRVEHLIKEYPRKSTASLLKRFMTRKDVEEAPPFRAVDDISFHVMHGETLGLVGESGCGKSTTSMMLMRLLDPTSGKIEFDGTDLATIPARDFARSPFRRRIQMVFQDPTDSLNPRYTAARAIADPLLRASDIGRADLRARCEELAGLVGLPLDLLDRLPHQLSGGQKARVGIARALALEPDLVVLDEPTAALDVSVQAIVLNLLQDLKERLGISYLFVSHDLHVVRLLCDRVIVMRAGKIVEQGSCEQVLEAPQAQYTRELIAAIPHPPFAA